MNIINKYNERFHKNFNKLSRVETNNRNLILPDERHYK